MIRPALNTIICLMVLYLGCRCGSPSDEPPAEDVSPADVVAPEDTGSPVSAEVSQRIASGDATAIAADMEARAARLGELATATGQSVKEMETTAESMTGRSEPLDPRDPETVTALGGSAEQLSTGTADLSDELAEMRQIVVDLQAEAEALYGRPQQ